MASISAHTFITDTLREIDGVIGHFVDAAYQNFIQENTTVITLIFTLYVMFIGYRILMRNFDADIISIASHMIVLLIVYGLIMNLDLYHIFIYDIFTNEPENIGRVLVESTGQGISSQGVGEALDGIYENGMQTAKMLFARRGLKLPFFGVVVACFTFIACLQALIFIIYAKMGMAVLLALGPIFILFVLSEKTKGLFNSWLNSLFVLALIPILTVTVLALMLSIINIVTDDLIRQTQAGEVGFFTIIKFGGLSFVNFSLLRQVLPMASSLGSGFSLQALKLGAPSAPSASTLSKVSNMAKKLTNMASKGNEGGNNSPSSQDKNSSRASVSSKNSKV